MGNPVRLKEDYQPGDLGFGIWDPNDVDLMDKELNNGRLAMIATLGMMVQELVTHQQNQIARTVLLCRTINALDFPRVLSHTRLRK